MRLWVLLVLVTSCISHDLTLCGDKLCPLGSRCVQEQYCVSDADAIACGEKAEGEACMVEGLPGGFCVEGNCIVPICGNLVQETGEACDDGNLVAGDRCSSDCRSDESCGNRVIDLVNEEDCDSGVPGLSGDGCTSSCKKEYETWHDLTPRVLRARQQHRMAYDADRAETVLFGGFDGTEPLNDTWVFTAGAWEQRFPTSSPEPRHSHSMVYDPVRKKTYLFGGTNGTEVFGGTWEWNGTDWTKLAVTGPSDRFGAAMAFHPGQQKTFLFGGSPDMGTRFMDTWTFDGAAWALVPTGDDEIGPDLVHVATPSMAYNENTGELVMLGKARFPGDTRGQLYFWYENRSWVDYETQDVAWNDANLVWDPNRRKIVLVAGSSVTGIPSGSVWEWNDVLLIFESSAASILPRTRASAVGTAGGLLLFGGKSSGGTPMSATLTRASLPTWMTITTTPLPSGRAGAMASYDTAARRSLLYGGTDATPLHDNWYWSDALWTPGPASNPGRRAFAGMTYDELDEEMILFGGTDGTGVALGSNGEPTGQCARVPDGGVPGDGGLDAGIPTDDAGVPIPPSCELADTWIFANGVWTRQNPVDSPSGRLFAATTYDAARDRVMLFGGSRTNGTFNDTWAWDRSTSSWTQLAPLVVPPKLDSPRMTYDRHRDVAVLYGTRVDGGETRGELWEFDGMMWLPRVTAVAPPARTGGALVYDPRRRSTILFGGKRPSGQLVDDTWEWTGATQTWTQRFPVQRPTPRMNAATLYDPTRGKILLFGGQGLLGIRLDDVWAFGFEAPGVAIESCDTDGDEDGDGLDNCLDPDCWGDCTPTCPPGASC